MTDTSAPQTLRGTILRDTQNGPGLISAQGQQFIFDLQQHWRSDKPPVTGAKVDMDMSPDGQLGAVRAVDEAQLAKELAQEKAQQLAASGQALFGQALSEFGKVPLAAMAGLLLGWFALDIVNIQFGVRMQSGLSFYELNKLIGAGADMISALQVAQRGSVGFWGLATLAVAAAPLAPLFVRDRRANWALAAPLALMLIQALRLYWAMKSAASQMQEAAGSNPFLGSNFAQEFVREMMKAISLGAGFYLSFAAAIVLAFFAWVRFQNRAR